MLGYRFKRVRAGDVPSAREWNAMCDAIEKMSAFRGASQSGVYVYDTPGGRTVSVDPSPTTLGYGVVQLVWAAATNYLKLAPCDNENGDNPVTAAGDMIYVLLTSPYNIHATGFGVRPGDVISYLPLGTLVQLGGDGKPCSGIAMPIPVRAQYGKLSVDWVPGANSVVLQPVNSRTDLTTATDLTGTALPTVTCFIAMPPGSSVPSLQKKSAGDGAYAYELYGDTYLLKSPNTWPTPASAYEAVTTHDGTQWVNDYPLAKA